MHLDRFSSRGLSSNITPNDCSCCGGFDAFFVEGEEGFVENIGEAKIAVRLAGSHASKVGASLRGIESGFDAERLQCVRQGDGRRFELEFRKEELSCADVQASLTGAPLRLNPVWHGARLPCDREASADLRRRVPVLLPVDRGMEGGHRRPGGIRALADRTAAVPSNRAGRIFAFRAVGRA